MQQKCTVIPDTHIYLSCNFCSKIGIYFQRNSNLKKEQSAYNLLTETARKKGKGLELACIQAQIFSRKVIRQFAEN